jgi:hypothetical protein
MIRRSTWIIIIIFALVIGLAVLIEKTPYFQASTTPTPTLAPRVLNLPAGSISAVKLTDSLGPIVSVKMNSSKVWEVIQPQNTNVDQGNMAELVSQLLSMAILSAPQNPPSNDASGLSNPLHTLTIFDVSNQEHTLKIGDLTPTSSGYFIQIDQAKPVVVQKSTVDRVIELLSGVRATPTAPPQLTPSQAAPAVTETPAPTPTP